MGGYGSGRKPGHWSKRTTEEQQRFDIRWLRKQGYLRPGSVGLLQWACGGRSAGWVHYRVEADEIKLNYRYGSAIKDWEQVEQTITLDRTPCNLGGHRKWFLCPRCGRRVAVLYGTERYFLCRHCYNLTYASQQEGQADRLIRRARNLRKLLGASISLYDPIIFKPKNMHERTFQRLKLQAYAAGRKAMWYGLLRFGIDP